MSKMRIVFLHGWSWLGSWLAHQLAYSGLDELCIVGEDVSNTGAKARVVEVRHKGRVTYESPTDARAPEFIARVREWAPHLIVSAEFPRKVAPALLALPTYGALNIHPSLLPRYRGAMPVFWAIRNGDAETGVTIHGMDDRFDSGPILACAGFPLGPDDTWQTVTARSLHVAQALLDEVLQRIRAGECPAGERQQESQVTHAPIVRGADLEIHWHEPAEMIDRLVRATPPTFGVHTRLRGERVVVRSVAVTSLQGISPGVVRLDPESQQLLVGTGTAALEIKTLERQPGHVTSGVLFALDVLNGQRRSR